MTDGFLLFVGQLGGRRRLRALAMRIGCICCRGSSSDSDAKCRRKKTFKRFVTYRKKRRARAVKSDAASNGINVASQIDASKPPENLVFLPPQIGEWEKKAAVGVDNEKTGLRQRRASADHRANRDGSGAAGVHKGADDKLNIVHVPNSSSDEQAEAGWPPWLTAVAQEAIKGWKPRKARSFEKLEKIGQGTYSTVYRARDLLTDKIVALKKVRFVNMDPESVRFMAREIHILRHLDHPNVIKLEGIITSRVSGNLYLVFPYMEHDLAGLVSRPGQKFSQSQVKCFMKQLLEGLAHCHSRGVLHRDIKGSNLLIDSNGILKIADFGLATIVNLSQKNELTSRVVTLWYRPPELLLGATEYGVAVDLWSSGCILAELFAGKPIMPGRTEVEQLHKIFKLCGSPSDDYWKKSKLPHTTIFRPEHRYRRCISEIFKDFPSSALVLLDSLLAVEPTKRGTATSALNNEFFKSKPLACDPSNLPTYPPSKEYDAKLRNEAIRRQKAEATKERAESVRPAGRRETKGMVVSDATKDLQKQSKGQYNVQDDRRRSGSVVAPPEDTAQNGYHSAMHPGGFLHSGPYGSLSVLNGPQLQKQRSFAPLSGATGLSDSLAKGNTGEASDEKILGRTTPIRNKDDKISSKESKIGHGTRNKRIQYSGPLMPPGGDVDDMLKKHERLIQEAVRKARIEKVK